MLQISSCVDADDAADGSPLSTSISAASSIPSSRIRYSEIERLKTEPPTCARMPGTSSMNAPQTTLCTRCVTDRFTAERSRVPMSVMPKFKRSIVMRVQSGSLSNVAHTECFICDACTSGERLCSAAPRPSQRRKALIVCMSSPLCACVRSGVRLVYGECTLDALLRDVKLNDYVAGVGNLQTSTIWFASARE